MCSSRVLTSDEDTTMPMMPYYYRTRPSTATFIAQASRRASKTTGLEGAPAAEDGAERRAPLRPQGRPHHHLDLPCPVLTS